jgi:hypothetical protein
MAWFIQFVEGRTAMKSILFSVIMSIVLFLAVSYVQRAAAAGSPNCVIEDTVTIP